MEKFWWESPHASQPGAQASETGSHSTQGNANYRISIAHCPSRLALLRDMEMKSIIFILRQIYHWYAKYT
jgi:hypothetical protein